MTQVSGNHIVSSSQVLSSGIASADHLTPDGMMLYLQTRLTGIDDQINAAFDKQQQIEQIRKILTKIQTLTAKLSPEDGGTLTDAQNHEIFAALNELQAIDPTLRDRIWGDLENAGIAGWNDEGNMTLGRSYDGNTTNAMNQIIGSTMKQLESSAQLEMIQLQSLMSARQTAIQLATNLVSAIGKGSETIVSNIGR